MMLGEIRRENFDGLTGDMAECRGQIMSIPQNQALFSIIGAQYGGDGRTTFALPTLEPTDSGPRYYIALQGIYPQWE